VELKSISGKMKAGIVLLHLERSIAREVIKKFSEDELLELGVTMSEMEKQHFNKETLEGILKEFIELSRHGLILGETTKRLFSIYKEALGEEKTKEIIKQIKSEGGVRPFEDLREIDADILGSLLHGEHPQTVALILQHVGTEKAAEILKKFPEEKQLDIVERLLTSEEATVDVMQQIGEIILAKAAVGAQDRVVKRELEDRIKDIADILNSLGGSTSKPILDRLSDTLPTMAEKIKDHMFVFSDLLYLSTQDIRSILTQVETKVIALSLKGVPKELEDHILSALSRRIRQIVRDEKSLMGAVPVEEVYEAQKELVQIARKLHEAGKIKIRKENTKLEMIE